MNILQLQWSLVREGLNNTVEKYCSNCGKKVQFIDSGLKRRNANGKDIFEFAIYKCVEGHTWNKKLRQFKATNEGINKEQTINLKAGFTVQAISISDYIMKGFDGIEIFLECVEGKWRFDKLLGDQILDLSRTRIQDLIKIEVILLDGRVAKPNELLKQNQQITIILSKVINSDH